MNTVQIKSKMLPLTAAAILAGGFACSNRTDYTKYAANKKTTQSVIDYTKRIGTYDCYQDFDSLVSPKTLEEIQVETNIDSDIAWRNFKANGKNNTSLDSIAMYDMALDHEKTTNAINYLKSVAAEKGFECKDIKPYYYLETKKEIDDYLNNYNAQKLYDTFMTEDSLRRVKELNE